MSLAEKWPRLHSDLRAFRDHFPGFDPTVHPSDGIRKVMKALQPKPLDPAEIDINELFIDRSDGTKLRAVHLSPASQRGVKLPTLLWAHGGGFIAGSPDNDNYLLERVVRSGFAAISVDYRLAPEDPFPAAIDDFQTAFDWLREGGPKIGVDSHRLVLGGSSAGANLAAVLSLRLTRRKEPVLPRLVVLDSPALDDRFDLYPSMAADHPLAHYQILNRADADMTMRYYAPDTSPDFGILRGRAEDFKGSPPQFVVYAELDCLRDQAHEYITKLLSVDVPVGSLLVVGAFHSFVRLQPLSLPAVRATQAIIDAMLEATREV